MEVPKDALPDVEQEVEAVEETPTPEPEVTDEPKEQVKPPKGYVPHEALIEERKKRKQAEVEAAEAEARLNSLSSSEPEVDTSDLESRLEKLEKQSIYTIYPNLADKQDEFEAFAEENPHYPLDAAAKIFMAENDMFEKPRRKGLERPTSGPKTPPKKGYTMEEIKDLRENNHRKYIDLLREGKITFDDSLA